MSEPRAVAESAGGSGLNAINLLQRIAARRPDPTQSRCEMCAEALVEEHSHVVNLASRNLMCTCRPCALLFAYDEAQLRYRTVGQDYLSFPELSLPAGLWQDLQIPVGLVFLFHNSALQRTVAFYPGPAGATESELPLEAWDTLVAAHPELGLARPDVEALLLRAGPATDGGAEAASDGGDSETDSIDCYLIPIDRCYELIGRLRQVWRGFDGGQQARAQLTQFFADIHARCRPIQASERMPVQR